MAVSQLPQAPYRQDRKIFPTPIIGDVLFSEVRDCNRGNPFPEYGTPYPNANKWPNHKLVYIKPVDIERNEIFEFFYAAERENQDLYNFAFGLRNIGNREFRMVTRTYVTLRENFKPEDIEFGTPMPNIPEGKFDGVSYVFFDKEQQNMQQEELNSLFVLEVHTYLEAAVLDEKLTLSVEKQDPLPPKFRVSAPTTTIDELAEGSVEMPVLTGDQLAVTEDQINTDLKRKRTVSRSSTENIGSLSGKQVTNDLQVADVVETIVPDGTTIETSALTVDGSVESLGNGQSVQRVITAPELFTAKSFSTQRSDLTPEKFRVLVPNQSIEESIAGTAEMPELTTVYVEATQQQVNVHVKRIRKTKRDATTLPKTLIEKATTNDKQIASVTETLQVGDTNETASATVDIQSQALGDGTYVVRKVEVPKLFDAKSYAVQKPDLTPEKFKAYAQTATTQTTKEGQAVYPQLTGDQIERSEQQINEYVFREQITERTKPSSSVTLSGSQTYIGGTVATTEESYYPYQIQADKGFFIQESKVTPIGDGSFIKETVKVNQWPKLYSGEWDSAINGISGVEQEIVYSNSVASFIGNSLSNGTPEIDYEPVNEFRSIKISKFAPKEIDDYIISSRTRININVPPILKAINLKWDIDIADGFYNEITESDALSIDEGSISDSRSGNISGSSSCNPILDVRTEQIWANDLVATNYYFFTKKPDDILQDLNRLTNRIFNADRIKEWPVFKPEIFTITAIGKSVTATSKWSASSSKAVSIDRQATSQSTGAGETSSIESNIDVIKIGPCLSGVVSISEPLNQTSKQVTATVSGLYPTSNFATAIVYPTTVGPTSPSDVPRTGNYLIDSKVDPYKWGYFRVAATVFDAAQFGSEGTTPPAFP